MREVRFRKNKNPPAMEVIVENHDGVGRGQIVLLSEPKAKVEYNKKDELENFEYGVKDKDSGVYEDIYEVVVSGDMVHLEEVKESIERVNQNFGENYSLIDEAKYPYGY